MKQAGSKPLRGLWPDAWARPVVAVVLIAGLPVFTLIIKLFEPPGEVLQHLARTVLWGYVTNSLLLMVFTGLLTAVVGFVCAWLVTTYAFPGRRWLEWLLVMPLSIPTYIMAYAYAGLFDYTGPIRTFLSNTLGWHRAPIDIMNVYGAVLVMGLVLYPYVYVSCRAALLSGTRPLLEAARSLGSSPWRTMVRVALPAVRPALVGGLTLVLMEVLNDYGAVKYYGVATFTTGIFRSWFSLGDENAAIYLSALLVLLVLVLVGTERWQRRRIRYDRAGKTDRPPARVALKGLAAVGATAVCALPLLLGFVVPVLQLLAWAITDFADAFGYAFGQMIANSFALAATAALLCVAVATLLEYGVKVSRRQWARGLSRWAVTGYAIPGAVIAVGVYIPLLVVDKALAGWLHNAFGWRTGLLLNGTVFTLLVAYMVRFLAVSHNPIEAGFARSGMAANDAARALGATPWQALWRINLPILRPTLLSAALLVFVDVLKELPLTLILRPSNFNTLATRAYELASDELISESSGASLVIIAVGLIPVLLLNRVITKAYGNPST